MAIGRPLLFGSKHAERNARGVDAIARVSEKGPTLNGCRGPLGDAIDIGAQHISK
jgi:hypothetical protein